VRSRELDLQFPDRPETFRALANWADRFGGTVSGEPHTDDEGQRIAHGEFPPGLASWAARFSGSSGRVPELRLRRGIMTTGRCAG
jgi:hypothetical protein